MHLIKLQVSGPWNQSVNINNDKTVEVVPMKIYIGRVSQKIYNDDATEDTNINIYKDTCYNVTFVKEVCVDVWSVEISCLH